MSYDTFISALRLVDALLAAVVFAVLVNRGRTYWDKYDSAQKWMYSAFVLYTVAVSYTSFELWAQEVDAGFRSYIVLLANLIALYALWRYRQSIVLGNPTNTHPSLR